MFNQLPVFGHADALSEPFDEAVVPRRRETS